MDLTPVSPTAISWTGFTSYSPVPTTPCDKKTNAPSFSQVVHGISSSFVQTTYLPHLIRSSAWPSNEGGTVRPSAFLTCPVRVIVEMRMSILPVEGRDRAN